jgi:hypothetical protein
MPCHSYYPLIDLFVMRLYCVNFYEHLAEIPEIEVIKILLLILFKIDCY